MKKLQFQIKINAPAEKVYKTMLGLDHKNTYEAWTAAFNPTSTYEGNWNEGSKLRFIGTDANGKKGGMVSEVFAHKKGEFVSVRHYGLIDGENEITSGEQVEKWAGGFENYTFHEKNGITTVTVDLDAIDDFSDYFNNTYPTALKKLKALIEK